MSANELLRSYLKMAGPSQKARIRDALQTPMTINELYAALPDISPDNIAPLVTQLKKESRVFVVTRRRACMKCGVEKMQDVYSSREEDRPPDYAEGLALLTAFCGLQRLPETTQLGRVYQMADE